MDESISSVADQQQTSLSNKFTVYVPVTITVNENSAISARPPVHVTFPDDRRMELQDVERRSALNVRLDFGSALPSMFSDKPIEVGNDGTTMRPFPFAIVISLVSVP